MAERGAEAGGTTAAAGGAAGPDAAALAAEPAPFTRRRLERIVERALRDAGVAGVLPTPLEEVQRAAGIAARHDIAALPRELATSGRELLGALWFERRAVYVDLAQPVPRRRFTDAHEAIHALCPWHEAVLREDTDAELFRRTAHAIEAEANYGAGLLIFQGRRFARRIADAPPDMATAIALAGEHGASRQATLHHLAQHHPGPVALLSIGRFPGRDGRLPVWRTVASPAFRRRFGRLGADLAPGRPLRELVEAARRFAAPAAARLRLPDASGTVRHWTAEAHYNRRTFFVLVSR
jgi:Zn-dependent peptidase ImmA (M78 family)